MVLCFEHETATYRISSNSHCLRIVAAQSGSLSEINPALLYTSMRRISDYGHRASAWAVRFVRLLSMADSRTERLRLLLTASNSRHCIACTYVPYPAIVDVGRLSK